MIKFRIRHIIDKNKSFLWLFLLSSSVFLLGHVMSRVDTDEMKNKINDINLMLLIFPISLLMSFAFAFRSKSWRDKIKQVFIKSTFTLFLIIAVYSLLIFQACFGNHPALGCSSDPIPLGAIPMGLGFIDLIILCIGVVPMSIFAHLLQNFVKSNIVLFKVEKWLVDSNLLKLLILGLFISLLGVEIKNSFKWKEYKDPNTNVEISYPGFSGFLYSHHYWMASGLGIEGIWSAEVNEISSDEKGARVSVIPISSMADASLVLIRLFPETKWQKNFDVERIEGAVLDEIVESYLRKRNSLYSKKIINFNNIDSYEFHYSTNHPWKGECNLILVPKSQYNYFIKGCWANENKQIPKIMESVKIPIGN